MAWAAPALATSYQPHYSSASVSVLSPPPTHLSTSPPLQSPIRTRLSIFRSQRSSSQSWLSKEGLLNCWVLKEERTKDLKGRPRVRSGDGIEERVGEGVDFDIRRLEVYTGKARSEVVCVHAMVENEEDQVIIFKGFSSSLMRPTAFDPGEPVLPSTAIIQSIDRIRGPYDPSNVRYIKQGLSWQEFQEFLKERGM